MAFCKVWYFFLVLVTIFAVAGPFYYVRV